MPRDTGVVVMDYNEWADPPSSVSLDVEPAANNPKEEPGSQKPDLSLIPAPALIQMAHVMMHGSKKYYPFSWRTTKIASRTYIAATLRHLLAYAEGEELDKDSGQPHLAHAMASLAILVDAQECGMCVDNRVLRPQAPPGKIEGFMPYVVEQGADGAQVHTDIVAYLQRECYVSAPEGESEL